MAFPLAHVADFVSGSWSVMHTLVSILISSFLLLTLQHNYVLHGSLRLRRLSVPLLVVLAVSLAALLAPATSNARGFAEPTGLPDLVSDPPFIWIERDVHDADNNVLHVLTFDGFLHNIGDGALDLSGNPQLPDGMKQRVFDGEEWTVVGTPTVRFENDDGHNHFHLINAADYTLWNEAQTELVDLGSKVGFCLLDTRQIEDRYPAAYDIDEINYCGVDDPDATELNMGITPGWHDVYEASLRLQWVDVSNTPPGRYWIGAIIDPKNEIVESNEDNNDTVFSRNKYPVSGYNAHDLTFNDEFDLRLRSSVFGTVGQQAFVIVDPPSNGTLSVPTGFDVLTDAITYVPDPGFTGTDAFTYYAHDTNTPFPFDPVMATVTINVSEAIEVDSDGDNDTSTEPRFGDEIEISTPTSEVSATRYDLVDLQVGFTGGDVPDDVTWYAKGLPAGVTIDPVTGALAGELTQPGSSTSTIMAVADDSSIEQEVTWNVEDGPISSLRHVNDISTSQDRRDTLLGAGTAETTYEAFGLPEGSIVTEGQPSLLGEPTESGSFEVTVNELLDGEIVDTMTFTLTVRNTTRPEFPL